MDEIRFAVVMQAPIAIVGRACVLPGALSPEALWQRVIEGHDLLGPVPDGVWGIDRQRILTTDPTQSADTTWSDQAGVVQGFEDVFDPTGFEGFSADEVLGLDRLFQWVLHTGREALKDAGFPTGRAGAVIGNLGFPSARMAQYAEHIWSEGARPAVDPRNRFMSGLPALMLAKALGLEIGAYALDAACASSLYAIKLACDQLNDGLADVMLAGAVNKSDDLFIHVGFSALNALSTSGRSRPFHAEADGLVPGEGAGMVVLKRLSDAVRDGDTIHGVIRGVGLSNDGRGGGLLAPAQEGQERAIRAAYQQSGLDPSTVSYVECHATGTPVGDGSELRSMASVFAEQTELPIGSLKSNMGHLITAAGVAGLIKVLEAMRHRQLPPTLHVDHPHPVLGETPFRPVTAPEPWEGRRAAVSAFGFGGNNAHLIVDADVPEDLGPVARPTTKPVAVVGVGVCAGTATSTQAFTETLLGGRDALESGEGRGSQVGLDLREIRFPPNDLKQTLGQQLMMLKATTEAVEGLDLPRETTGILVGMGTDAEVCRFGARWRLAQWKPEADDLAAERDAVVPVLQSAGVLGTMPNIPANRLNVQLDLGGPSFTLSAEEHSGHVALSLALRALRSHELDAVIVGACDVSCEPVHQAALKAVLGNDDPAGDAAVAMVLRRQEDVGEQPVLALVDECRGVVEPAQGSGPFDLGDASESSRGRMPESSRDEVGRGLDGRGTTGPLERTGQSPRAGQPQSPVLTHRFGRAHVAHGLLQVAAEALQFHHRVDAEGTPNLDPRPTQVQSQAMDGTSRQVTVSPADPGPLAELPRFVTWSGADRAEVLKSLEANRPSTEGPARLVIVADNQQVLERRIQRAKRHLQSGAPAGEGVHFTDTPITGKTAFVYGAAGAAYRGMGRGLLRGMPHLVDSNFAGLKDALQWSFTDGGGTVLDKLWGASALCQLHTTLSRSLGLTPDAAIGVSSGESNALFAMGVWSDLDQMMQATRETGLFHSQLGGSFDALAKVWGSDAQWVTWTVLAPVGAVLAEAEKQERAFVTAIHTDNDCVLAGDPAACDAVLSVIGRERAVRLDYDLMVHVPLLDAHREPWHALHRRPVVPNSEVTFYSGATSSTYEPSPEACADAITQQALQTIDFRKTIEQAYADGVRVFVEHGPRGACGRWIREILRDRPAIVVSWDKKGRDVQPVFDTIAELMAGGVEVDPSGLGLRPTLFDANPTEMALDVHWPPVRLQLARPRLESHPGDPSMALETQPMQDNPTPAVQEMAPAPWLPPVSEAPVTPALLPRAEPPTPTPVDVPVSQGPPAMSSVAPNPGLANVFAEMQAHSAQLGAIHQDFLQQQSAMHQQFLQMRQNALIGFLNQAGQPAVSHSVPAQPTVQAPPESSPVATRATQPQPVVPKAPVKVIPQAPKTTPVVSRPAAAKPAVTKGAAKPVVTEPPIDAKSDDQSVPAHALGPASDLPGLKLSREQLNIHASGNISEIYGEMFTAQDGYHVQVRMPEPPLLLADRVVGIDAEPGSLGKGTIWTETDVTWDSWYLNHGKMPAGVMIEAGQADLMLISYLGIDFLNNKGDRKYRLLGCELTYHNTLPSPGETMRYDIHCDGHANQGPVRLFFFHYDCRVDGELRLSVRGGQAGFFTDQELDDSAGIIWTPETQEVVPDPHLDAPLVPAQARSYTAEEIQAFSEGQPWRCFGEEAFMLTKTHNRTPKIQQGRMLFLETIPTFDPQGGPWKRGYLKAETTIHPDDWYFDGHFKNDPCMPGTLMFEGCLQAMAFYMTAMGVTLKNDGWRFQPVMGEPFDLKCRGQVIPSSKLLTYEVFVEEFIAGPTPTLYADLLCVVDGLGAFHARRVGLQLVPDWPITSRPQILADHTEPTEVAEIDGFRFDYASLVACAWAKPSLAFGKMYEVFNGHRRVARLPGPPYHFMSRVTRIDGDIGACVPGAVIELEYDIPPDAWYFDENGNRTMPFAVLLEAALQPCGWLASFVGSALTVDEDLSFRNLDGTGTLTEELFSDAGTLRTVVKITNISQSAGMIIESFEVECFLGDKSVYTMNTVFGFFPLVALENQVGLPTNDEQRGWLTRDCAREVDLTRRPQKYCGDALRLPQPMLLMLDRVHYWPGEGEAGLGVLRGAKDVDPAEWFFKAHFFQDPVQPGSLGIEAMIQLLQFYMLETGMGQGIKNPRFEPLQLGAPMTWKYRGQVVPKNKLIQSTMEITETGTDEVGPFAVAKASLWVDGKRIYEASNIGMRIVASPTPERAMVPVEAKGWVADHCPTWTVPALPMMSMVDLLAQHGEVQTVGLRDVRVKQWLVADTDRSVWTQQDGNKVTLYANGDEAIAEALVTQGEFEQPPRVVVMAEPSVGVFDGGNPYDDGRLFHGAVFQRLLGSTQVEGGAVGLLDCAPTAVPLGTLHPVLLDAGTHVIPHDNLHRWDNTIPEDQVAYPAFIPRLDVYGPPPTTGSIRIQVRYQGQMAPGMPRFLLEWIKEGGTLWARMELVERCFPKGPLGLAAPEDRRAFLRDHAFVPGLTLSRRRDGETRLNPDEVAATDWLPGTVQGIYGTRDVQEIAKREHLGQLLEVHPRADTPFNQPSLVVATDGQDVVVSSTDEGRLDISEIKAFWGEYFGVGRWPVEDLYYGLIERFVRRVVLTDPTEFEAVKGKSALYLANHQVGIESLEFSILIGGLTRLPTVTLAKVEHQDTWLGKLIKHNFSYPDIQDPEVIRFFDRNNKEALPGIIMKLAQEMHTVGRNVLIHVEGTRSKTCRRPVEKMSGAFLDMAIQMNVPVVPVRFVGGVPTEELPHRLEFPVEMGQQDIWLGRPISPEELAAMPYAERKAQVIDALNALGPPHVQEEPLAGDPGFAKKVAGVEKELGIAAPDAVLLNVLRECAQPSAGTQALLDALVKGHPVDSSTAEGAWLSVLARQLGSK